MNANNDLDRRLAAGLLDGPAQAPEGTVALALAHAHAHPRRRDRLAFLRRDPMHTQSSRSAFAVRPLPLLAILALLLAAGLAVATAGGLFEDRSVVVPPIATPSPSTSVPASPVPSAAPSASAGPSASPSPPVISVDLIEHVGADATIDITDRSGHLVGAASGTPGDGASVPDGIVAVSGIETDPETLVLTWSGTPCDTTHQLTIEPDGMTMSIERPACQGDAIAVDHVLQLTFDHPVDPATLNVTIRTVGN